MGMCLTHDSRLLTSCIASRRACDETDSDLIQKLDVPYVERMPGTKWHADDTQLTLRITGREISGSPVKRKKPVAGSIAHSWSGVFPKPAYSTLASSSMPDGHETTSFTGACASTRSASPP